MLRYDKPVLETRVVIKYKDKPVTVFRILYAIAVLFYKEGIYEAGDKTLYELDGNTKMIKHDEYIEINGMTVTPFEPGVIGYIENMDALNQLEN